MSKYAKAIVATLTTFAAGFTGAILDASPGGEHVTHNEWILIAVTSAISGVAVWAVPNTPPGPVE